MVDELAHVYCDNLKSIKLSRKPIFHPQMKHIKVCYYCIHEWIIVGDLGLPTYWCRYVDNGYFQEYIRTSQPSAIFNDNWTTMLGIQSLMGSEGKEESGNVI